MPTPERRIILLVWSCVLALCVAGCTNIQGHTMDTELNTIDWQTHCLGRYLLDLPSSAEVSAIYEYGSGDVKTITPITERGFRQFVEKRVAKLKSTKNIEGGQQLADITRYDDQNVLITSWYSPNSKIAYKSELYSFHATANGSALYILTDQTRPDKLSVSKEIRQKIAKTFQYRHQLEIPQGPGFCINSGFIASDMPNFEEVDATITFPKKPGLSINIVAYSTEDPPDKTMFEREASISLPAKLMRAVSQANRLRHDYRTINGMPGQEIVYSHEADNGIEYYLAHWQTRGKADSMRYQRVRIELSTSENHIEGPLFENEEQALAFWDAILESFHMRPGAAGNTR